MTGTKLDGVVEKITDGDTVRVIAADTLFKIRVLGLDTEESNTNTHKPVTPWGKAASNYVASILPVGAPVTIEFPGTEPALVNGEINTRYLDNYQRPLGYLYLHTPVEGMTDLTEIMIRWGFSPYFVKYGRSVFPENNLRYAHAERMAQIENLGIWDQLTANGATTPEAAPRNYARLMVWWELRARIIDGFRAARGMGPARTLFNTRIDYTELAQKAQTGETVTVFMELRTGRTVGGVHHLIDSGSHAQPFQLFLPEEDRPEIVAVKNLIANRYTATGEDYPRRNYAYITGPLQLFRGRPQMVVESAAQIADVPPLPVEALTAASVF